MTKELLAHRKKMKAKKPAFRRQDSHKYTEVSPRWRRPRGLHSKMRLKKRGYSKSVEIGYGSPQKVRYTTKEGLFPVLVSNEKELEKAGKENIVVIRSSVGKKRKIAIINSAKEKGLKIANFKNPDEFVEKILEEVAKKKKKTEEIKAAAKKKEKAEKKTEEKPADEKQNEEDKKKAERKEMEKTITKRA